jgi:hypothetical protein
MTAQGLGGDGRRGVANPNEGGGGGGKKASTRNKRADDEEGEIIGRA